MSGDSLPVNWEEWKLSDVGDWFGGGTPSKSEERFWNGSIPWVSPKDMKVTSILDAEDHISLDAVASSAAKIIPPGAVLFVTRSGILAHSFPVSTTRTNVTINQDLKAIVPFQPIDPEYLSWCLRAHARSILDRCTKDGTTVHSIEAPALKAYRVPISPIEEQRRIVAKVEALFSELDKGIENLKTAREQLKVYRQAVLKQAFEGKLTAQWHEETNQPAFERRLLGKMLSFLTSGSRGWAKFYSTKGEIFIRAQNLRHDRLDLDDVAYVRLPELSEGMRTQVQVGDLLITIYLI